jgi:dedicator of cytokinesis protein 3
MSTGNTFRFFDMCLDLTTISSDINLFSCSRQFNRPGRDSKDELWEEKTYFTTEETFPTVLRRSEVVDIQIAEISPVQNAISEIELKTKELTTLELKYSALAKTGQPVSTNALTAALNSAVDNLTTSRYRQMFLHTDYLHRYPERAPLIQSLTQALLNQVNPHGG